MLKLARAKLAKGEQKYAVNKRTKKYLEEATKELVSNKDTTQGLEDAIFAKIQVFEKKRQVLKKSRANHSSDGQAAS